MDNDTADADADAALIDMMRFDVLIVLCSSVDETLIGTETELHTHVVRLSKLAK